MVKKARPGTKQVQNQTPTRRTRTRRQIRKPAKQKIDIFNFSLTMPNFLVLAGGFVLILLGFVLMSFGITEDPAVVDGQWNNVWSVSVAPVLLVLGYCLVIPFGLMKVFNKEDKQAESA